MRSTLANCCATGKKTGSIQLRALVQVKINSVIGTLICASPLWIVMIGLLAAMPGQVAWSDSIPISNASFENATGYHAYENPPSSWVSASNNIIDTGGLTENDSYIGQVSSGSAQNKHGNNYLVLSLEVGPVGIVGKTVTCWIPTTSLGTYQPNSIYTLTVAQAALTAETNRHAIIALAADGVVVASLATSSYELNLPGYIFQDKQVILDTGAHPEVVGQSITVQLMQQATPGAQYSRYTVFDNVRLDVTAAPQDNYASWAAQHNVGAVAADDDGDGLNNLVEYAFNLDPQTPDASSASFNLRQVSTLEAQHRLQFSCLRPATMPADVTAKFQVSNDLISWTDAVNGVDYTEMETGDDPKTVTATATNGIDQPGGYRFSRLVWVLD